MSGLAWFKLYPKDMAADAHVKAMTAAAFGAYMRLLMSHWELGEIPDDPVWMARTAGMPLAPFKRVWPQLEPCFTLVKERHAWVQKRMHAELEKVAMKAAKNRINGAKGADTRWHDGVKTDSHTEKPRSQETKNVPPTAGAVKVRKKPSGDHAEVVEFWMALWLEVRGSPYAFEGGKDGAAVKTCLKYAAGDTELVKQRMTRLLEDPPDAWTAQQASLSILASKWNPLGVHITPVSKIDLEIQQILNPKANGHERSQTGNRDSQAGQTLLERLGGTHPALGE